MTAEETAASICEFAVAKLDVKPGDVVVMKMLPDWGPEHGRQMSEILNLWSEGHGLNLHFLVVPNGFDLSVVHTLTPEEVEKAGAGGWPHEQSTT